MNIEREEDEKDSDIARAIDRKEFYNLRLRLEDHGPRNWIEPR